MTKSEARCHLCGARNRVAADTRGKPRCAKCHADLPWLADVDGSEFARVIANSSLPVLVDLWAPWCGPCRAVAPALVELSEELAGTVRIVKVNVDQAPAVQASLGVQGIPTMVVYADGVEVGRQVGAMPKHAIRAWLDKVLASTAGH